MRILGIDYGDARVGVAMCDMLGITAQGIETIQNSGVVGVITTLSEMVKKHDVKKVVLGMPKNMNGTVGERGEKTLKFAEKLEKATGVEIIFFDERLTTVSAINVLNQTNTRGVKRKEKVDMLSAMFILQAYLDSSSGNGGN